MLTPHISLADVTRTSKGKNDVEQVLRYGRIHSADRITKDIQRTAELVEQFIVKFGGTISSFYRSPRVNGLVGGARNSAHVVGLACDFLPSAPLHDVVAWAVEHAEELAYDRLILEKRGKTCWLHIQLAEEGAAPQRLLFSSPSGGLFVSATRTTFVQFAKELEPRKVAA